MNNEYPAYFKATDPDGNAIALVVNEAPSTITIIQHNKANGRTSFQRVATVDDVRQSVGGELSPVDPFEYEEILFDQWAFSLSLEVFGAAANIEEGIAAAPGLPSDVDDASEAEHGNEASTVDDAGTSDDGTNGDEGTGSQEGTSGQVGTDEPQPGTGDGSAPDDSQR